MGNDLFCVGCGVILTLKRRKFCSETCKEEFCQRRYEEEIQAGTLETQAKEELHDRFTSMPFDDGLRRMTGSTCRAANRRAESEKEDEAS